MVFTRCKCYKSSLPTFFQESRRFFRKVGKKLHFAQKAKLTVRNNRKELFAIGSVINEIHSFGESFREEVQAKKSIRRMPWHREPTKDVTNCDKLRVAVNKH